MDEQTAETTALAETEAPAVVSESTSPAVEAAKEAVSDKPISRRERLDGIYDKLSKDESKAKDDKTPIERQREAAEKPKAIEKTLEKPLELKPQEQKKELPKKISKFKPPTSWSPEQHKIWDGLSEEAKAIVAKRERDIGGLAQRYEQQWKPVQQFGQAFAQMVGPYKSMMESEAAAQGQAYAPLQTVNQLLQTYAALHHSDKRVGASVLAQAMQAYGISPEQVADALEGKGIPANQAIPQRAVQQQPAFDPNKLLEQAEARIMQKLQGAQAARDHAEAETEIGSFANEHEHLDVVRERMADLIEMNARRMEALPQNQRVAMTLEEAYHIACLTDPAIAADYQQAMAEKAQVAQASTTPPPATVAKTTVASSIRGRPGGTARPAQGKPLSRREGLAQLWAQRFEGR